jgi:aminoglycoside N3'-acetyltransferase
MSAIATRPKLTAILQELDVKRDRVLFVHSSTDWLARIGITADELLKTLTEWVDSSGTLVVPCFPYAGTEEDYLRTEPRFDVRRTPCRAGLLGEMVRRLPGARRSPDPDLSVAARGQLAEGIVGRVPRELDAFGPDSSFRRVLANPAQLVGLGVSLNTMSLIHVIDSRLQDRYPIPIYTTEVMKAELTDHTGTVHMIRRRAVRRAVQRHIKPYRMVEEFGKDRSVFRLLAIEGVNSFVWNLPRWEPLAMQHAEERSAVGRLPCWLETIPPAQEP